MSLSFGPYEDVVFEDSPLVAVLSQIRFRPITALLTEVGIVGFQEALRPTYPELTEEHAAEVGLARDETTVRRKVPIWRMSDETGDWAVGLAVDFVSLETQAYEDFAGFLRRLDQVVDALDRTIHPGKSTRVGLRYINDFSQPVVERPADWADWLRGELLGILQDPELPGTLEMGLNEIRLRDANGDMLAIRHGFMPSAPVDKYRLDMDYFTERPLAISADSDIAALLQTFSDALTGFFHSSLTNEMRSLLKPRSKKGV